MLCAAGLFCLSLLFWPVDTLVIKTFPEASAPGPLAELPVFAAPAPLGQQFWTGYLHSVEQTPVLDAYRIIGGRIWSWREYTRSHNAGLPFGAPALGRFRLHQQWMVIEGGRRAWPHIVLRVGDAELGRNVFAWERGGKAVRLDFYKHYKNRRLILKVERRPLLANFRPVDTKLWLLYCIPSPEIYGIAI